ncbi:hypothetical protein Ttaiw_02676 [Tepidimonas taiwanensis]|uniref:Uncharacterized protein n=1 Tax=Tepidimonas taiwanensis TaxID=307486 RepID=A0A554WWZ7_9BURK|nr:hypothetical protein Ttaiw_02676 [Tepidimonas taiwanensis]
MQPVTLLALEVAPVHAVILLQVPDDRLDGLAALEQLALLLREALDLAAVHQAHIRNVGFHPAVAQIGKRCAGLDASVLHQDRGLLQLRLQRVPVVGVAMEGPGCDDEAVLQGAGNADLDAELVRAAGLALVDALHLRRVPGVELSSPVGGLSVGSLRHQTRRLVEGVAKSTLDGLPQAAGLALDLALQPGHDRALALDDPAHARKLPRVRIASCLAGQLLAFLGKGLLQGDAGGLGRLHQLGACRLQQPAVGGVRHRLGLYGGVHHHALEFLRLDESGFHRHVDGLRQEFFHAFFAQQPAKLHQRRGVARPAMFKVRPPREELPCGGFAPALDHPFVRLVEGVLQIQQRDHHAQRHAGSACVGRPSCAHRRFAKEVQIGHRDTCARFAHEQVRQPCFQLLPRHA